MKTVFKQAEDIKKVFNYSITLIFFIFLFLLLSCSPLWHTRRFKLLKKEGINIDTTIVRIDGVYLCTDSIIDLNKQKQPSYAFMRFFNNGRLFSSYSYYHFPTNTELNDLSNGSYNHYLIDKNVLIKESYTVWAGYFFSYYAIKDDIIKYIGTSRRDWGKDVVIDSVNFNLEYKFYKTEVNSKPFW